MSASARLGPRADARASRSQPALSAAEPDRQVDVGREEGSGRAFAADDARQPRAERQSERDHRGHDAGTSRTGQQEPADEADATQGGEGADGEEEDAEEGGESGPYVHGHTAVHRGT